MHPYHEMINVYHDKAGKLAMTHYCAMGNQPHLDLVTMAGTTLSFSLSSDDTAHLADEGHMHDLTITMSDDGHLQQEFSEWLQSFGKFMIKCPNRNM